MACFLSLSRQFSCRLAEFKALIGRDPTRLHKLGRGPLSERSLPHSAADKIPNFQLTSNLRPRDLDKSLLVLRVTCNFCKGRDEETVVF